ncbi:MAG: V-type ATPase subunit, partial [Clostridia bacterium]|nr:V-type ATPase subunit [Clostridia bacterium]
SSHGCSLVRFLNEDGAREYNITVDNVKDTVITISSAAILFGETYPFAKKQVRQMGEFENFVIRNVTTNAQRGINLCEPTRNLIIENLTTYGRNEIGINAADNFACENLVIRNFTFDSDEADADCVFQFGENAAENMKDYEISHVRAKKAKHVFRGSRLEVEDFKYEEPSVSEFEKYQDKAKNIFVQKANFVTIGAEPLIAYILKKQAELLSVRIIMSGKINGFSESVIRERLRD